MKANTNNPTNITLTAEQYQEMLEVNMEQSREILRLRKSLGEEYRYAETLIAECNRLNDEVKRLKAERFGVEDLGGATVAPETAGE